MKKLNIIKIGGKIIDDEIELNLFINDLIKIEEPIILIHGGGKIATDISKKLGIETAFVDGRRITKQEDLNIAIMVYAGLINKKICAQIQFKGKEAIGLTGVDLGLIPSKRKISSEINWGFVGIPNTYEIKNSYFNYFLEQKVIPVIAPLTLDEGGQICNTNADTIAMSLAISLSSEYQADLHYCFEKEGVLDKNLEIIPKIDQSKFFKLKEEKVIIDGIIPKIEESINAIESGVNRVFIYNSKHMVNQIKYGNYGTEIIGINK